MDELKAKKVVALVKAGHSAAEVARELNIPESTVRGVKNQLKAMQKNRADTSNSDNKETAK